MSGEPRIRCCNGMDPSCDGLDVCAARAWTEVERLEAARQQLLNAARGYMDMVCEERDNNERLRAGTLPEPCRVQMTGRRFDDWCERCGHMLVVHTKDTGCSICVAAKEVRRDH